MGGRVGEGERRDALAPGRSSHYRNCRYENPQTDPPVSRPRGNHTERREVIARAAADAIATRGLEQVTLRDIAAALGVTTGVLTHYFPSKDALVAFTKAQAFNRHLTRARDAAAGTNGIERLHAVVTELLPVDAERRTSWRLLVAFHGSAVGSAAMRRAHDRRMRAWFAFFAELVAPLGVADAEATGMAVALFVEGMAVHVAMMQRPRPAAWQRAFARTQVERLVSPTTPS
jgi:AcrR family transcriptional regulator